MKYFRALPWGSAFFVFAAAVLALPISQSHHYLKKYLKYFGPLPYPDL
jgi:hypothetical protein